MRSEFNEMIILGEAKKKKGGSLSAVLKLIQDLTDFEEKLQDCIDSQEMSENKQKIEGFVQQVDQMYDVLFEIARGGISSIRNDRASGVDLEDAEESVEPMPESEVVLDEPPRPEIKVRREMGVRTPIAPKI